MWDTTSWSTVRIVSMQSAFFLGLLLIAMSVYAREKQELFDLGFRVLRFSAAFAIFPLDII